MKSIFTTYKSPILITLALVLGIGIYAYSRLQTSLFPDVTFPKIKVIAENGQQPVGKMMVTVTRPLEEAIKRVPALQYVRSVTSQGSCEISAFLSWNADVDLSKQQIESQLMQITGKLPSGVSFTVEKMNPSILPVQGYSVENPSLNKIELRSLAEYTIKPFLSRIDGVAAVEVIGGKVREYRIYPDQARLSQFGLSIDKVVQLLSRENYIKANGHTTDYHRLYLSITDASVHDLAGLQNLVLINTPERLIRLKDVAEVSIGEQKQYVKINANGHDIPLIAILKQPGANLMQVADDVTASMSALQATLPSGTVLTPYYDQSVFVRSSVRSMTDVLIAGLALALIVAILFLRSWKASAVILISIPVTLALTMVVLDYVGYTLNIMTLGAIAAAIGLVIDDAIVVVEQIHRTHEEHPGRPTRNLVGEAIHYLFPAMLGSSMSTIVIFFPFVLMSGVAGAYFSILTNTMIITLVCSFLVSWLGTPVIYLAISSSKRKERRPDEGHDVKQRKWVGRLIHRPLISVIMVAFLAVSIILLYPKLPTGFLPEMDEGAIVLDFSSPPGTSLEETDRMLDVVDKVIRTTPEVAGFSRRTGTQMGFFITEPNRGDYLIRLDKDRHRSTEEVADGIRRQVESAMPALTVDFGQVIGDMLGDLMSSVQPVEIKVFGPDLGRLHQLARQVAGMVARVPGTADVFDGIVEAGPVISVTPDLAKLAQYGITPDNFYQIMQAGTDGVLVGGVLEKDRETAIRLLASPVKETSVDRLRHCQLLTPDGQFISLDQVATIRLKPGETEIERENLQTMVPVTARLNGRDLGSVMSEIRQTIGSRLALPQGYHIVYGGSYQQQQRSFHELLLILIIAGVLVFTVILFLFRRISLALVILLIAILGIAGSVLALYLTGTPLNVGSYTGMIMIIGIIGENAIFTCMQFIKAREEYDTDQAITYAISTRLRPKLMTAIGAIIALLPLALGIGTGAELHQPLAIAVIGGFMVALPLLLVILPSILRITINN